MAAFPEGAPCWADVMLPDPAAGRRFYGELLGWTFDEPDPARHGYATARHRGRAAAAVFAKPDGRMPTAWNVYFAVHDAADAARRVRAAGGQVVAGPEPVGPAGTMVVAADPSGGVFGMWQAGRHAGFEVTEVPGSFCWTELNTRDPRAADPFYRRVFGYRGEQLGTAGGDFDYEVWRLPAPSRGVAGGRLHMGHRFPAEFPSHFGVLFAVADCDATAAAVRSLGGRVLAEPHDTPYGRLAPVADDQGAHFTVIDLSKATARP